MSLTDQQQADAAAALAVFDRYIKVVNAANENPGAKNWTKDIRTVAADPLASRILESIGKLRALNYKETQHANYERVTVAMVKPTRISLEICADLSGVRLLNMSGKQVNRPSDLPQKIYDATIQKFALEDGRWLVADGRYADPLRQC